MAHKFSVNVQGNISEKLAKIKQIAKEAGVNWRGTDTSGNVSGRGVVGDYIVQGNAVIVNLTKGPFGVPLRVIEGKVREFIRKA